MSYKGVLGCIIREINRMRSVLGGGKPDEISLGGSGWGGEKPDEISLEGVL